MPQVLLDHSYKNFHAKGLDYLCLKRTPEHTVKVYFFDGDADLSALPEIVMPHDHRYAFDTTILAGAASNLVQARCAEFHGSIRYHAFDWDTPLNGGAGFSYRGVEHLTVPVAFDYESGQGWRSRHSEIHTLRIRRAGTILRLDQWSDVVPVGVPTQTFKLATDDREPARPETTGLYERMDADYAARRMLQLQEAARA